MIQTETSQSFQAVLNRYKDDKDNKRTFSYLNLMNQFLESRVESFFESVSEPSDANELLVSIIKSQHCYVLVTNYQRNAFESIIRQDFHNYIDSDFLSGFIQVIEKRTELLRQKDGNQQFRGRVLTFSKDNQLKKSYNKNYPSYDRPILLRIDYSIVREMIEYPNLEGSKGKEVKEVVQVAYTLSSIKKEFFNEKEIKYYINDSYRLLKESKNIVTPLFLTEKILQSQWFRMSKQIIVYKNVDKRKLVFDSKATIQTLPCLKNIKLVLTYTKWQNESAYFGTGFLFDHRAVITSGKVVTKSQKFVISVVQVCLNPTQSQRKWIPIQAKDIKRFQHSDTALLILPAAEKTKRVATKIEDCSKNLPSYVYCTYVYGFKFAIEGQTLKFYPVLSRSIVKQRQSFDSFYDIKSHSSNGSLVFYVYNNEFTVFGIYNPFSKSVFNFDLIHGGISQEIHTAIESRNFTIQAQVMIKEDERQTVKIEDLIKIPYSAIGMIYSKIQLFNKKNVFMGERYERGNGAQGTGTFIAPNIILTCAHNVLNQFQLGGTMIAKEIYFYPGLSKQDDQNKLSLVINGNHPHYTIPIEHVYIPSQYQANYLTRNQTRYTSDIAILYLKNDSHPYSVPIKQVAQNNKAYWDNTKLMVCGYPGQSQGTMKQAQGKAISDTSFIQQNNPDFRKFSKTLYYQIDASQGNSGTAVIAMPEQDRFEVVAIHTLGYFHQQEGKKVGLVNSGVLLVEENLQFVNEKLKVLNGQNIQLGGSLKEFYTNKFG